MNSADQPSKTEAINALFKALKAKLRTCGLRETRPLRQELEDLEGLVTRWMKSDEDYIAALLDRALEQAEAARHTTQVQRARPAPATTATQLRNKGRILAMLFLTIAATVLVTSAINGKSLIKINLDGLVNFFTRESSLPPAKTQTADTAATNSASAGPVGSDIHLTKEQPPELTDQNGSNTADVGTAAVTTASQNAPTNEVIRIP